LFLGHEVFREVGDGIQFPHYDPERRFVEDVDKAFVAHESNLK
jgi:hypothetical protein